MAAGIDIVTTGSYLLGMKSVGIKQLKGRLSEYLRLVKAGETVLVTERDEVVAELRPARPLRGALTGTDVRRAPPPSSLDEVLESLEASGELTRAATAKGQWGWAARGLGLPGGTASTILDELRSDRSR